MTVCWADDEKHPRRTAFECWPNTAISGELTQILPVPAHFEQATKMRREEDVAQQIVCGPDPAPYIEELQDYAKAGFSAFANVISCRGSRKVPKRITRKAYAPASCI